MGGDFFKNPTGLNLFFWIPGTYLCFLFFIFFFEFEFLLPHSNKYVCCKQTANTYVVRWGSSASMGIVFYLPTRDFVIAFVIANTTICL
jgi:hypothetical protein